MGRNTVEGNGELESIVCPLCSSSNYENVYQCYQETGYTLGRIRTSFVVCRECGFMFQNPRPTSELLKKHYSQNIEASGAVYHDEAPDSVYDKKQKSRIEFYEKHFKKLNKGTLIEIGCSTGAFLKSLNLDSWELTGLEASVDVAQQAVSDSIKIIPEFLEDADLPASSFDIVCCFGVLEHLFDINKTVQIMTNIMKTGGLLCVEIPDTMKPEPQISEFFTFEHMSHFTRETLTMFLEGYGYSDFIFDDTVVDARLRVIAVKTGEMKPVFENGIDESSNNRIMHNREKIILAVNGYKLAKKAFENELKDRLLEKIESWTRNGKNIAIYGAGVHTRYLMSLFNISDNVTAIMDSDPKKYGKKYLRWNISDEFLLESGEVDAVIISSKAYEEEIYARLKKYSRKNTIEIVRCYS